MQRKGIMKPTGPVTAVGVFVDRTQAEYAVEELRRNGFAADQIGFLTPDAAPSMEKPDEEVNTKAEEGGAVGAAAGAAVGGLLGAALATAFIPGIGPVIAGGLFAGALGGAVTGLVGGGIVGSLIGLQIPEEEARRYEREFHSGRTLVTVRANDRYDDAVAVLCAVEEKSMSKGHSHSRGRLSSLRDEGDSAPGAGTVGSPPP
jgi:hypothetical protein